MILRRCLGRRALSLLGGVVLLLPSFPALADSSEENLVRAVIAKERALDEQDPALWQEAFRLFRIADTLHPTPETKYEIGYAAERLGRTDLALEAYEAALRLGLKGPAQDHAQRFVTRYAPALAYVQLEGVPAGTGIYANGVYRGTMPIEGSLVVVPGEVRIEVVRQGERSSVQLLLRPGERRTVSFSAEEPAQPTAPREAVRGPEVVSVAGPVAPDTVINSSSDRSASSMPWVLMGTGLGVATVAAILITTANVRLGSERRALSASCEVRVGSDACRHALPGRQGEAQRQVDAIATWKAVRMGSWVGVGVGGALLVTGTALLLGRDGAEGGTLPVAGDWRLDVAASPEGPSLSLSGTF